MINLIPNHEKKKKVKDFYFRLTVVFLATLGICATAGVVSILPAYFLSAIEKKIANAELNVQKNEPATALDQNLSAVVEDLNKKFTIVATTVPERFLVSQAVIREIALRRMPDIKIRRIVYEKDASGGSLIRVSGLAPSRERLLLFRQKLEATAIWEVVDLPISNFIKGADIEFNLSLTSS